MPTYVIKWGISFVEMRERNVDTPEIEEEQARVTRESTQVLRELGYGATTSGHSLYDGYDGLVRTNEPLDSRARATLKQRVFNKYSVPLSIEEGKSSDVKHLL